MTETEISEAKIGDRIEIIEGVRAGECGKIIKIKTDTVSGMPLFELYLDTMKDYWISPLSVKKARNKMEEFQPHYTKDGKKILTKPENIRNLPWWANKNRIMFKAIFWGIETLENSFDRIARKHNSPQECIETGQVMEQLELIKECITKIICGAGFEDDIFPPCKYCGSHGCDCDK